MLPCSRGVKEVEFQTKRFIAGAREARGTCVVIDVFRASNTIISILDRGADCIIPVACLSVANLIKQENPDYLLFGERDGVKPQGFDFNNSPSEAAAQDLTGQTVIVASSAGTKGIVNARHTEELIVASFANAKAAAAYIRKKAPPLLTFLAIGLNAEQEAEEDEMCARHLQALILGKRPRTAGLKEKLLATEGADRLRRLGQTDDLEFCTRLDTFDIVPRATKGLGLWRLRA